ncbi:ribonuclease M5 [Anaerobacillus alkalidiazotrophicus]|uniref:Ribonuclease M5 n=1 Tax=Anaerobacillus alkalidiazotrophicus TaxID=472963 RepID=A0A1S2MA31_9BACI|nr:ribonuclease M5 [Anaerobacillus alkalidiazotrophicus]OIJ20535.1 ribonuclease M5 [Anaerobacillus alkalidiazotrophicus]
MKIKEIIVVEGKDDTVAVKNAVDADTIETSGSAIGKKVIEQIKLAKDRRGVIVLTDPDYPGERIRKIISQQVPGCKHAFLPKKEAISKKGNNLGVENATADAIRLALKDAQQESDEWREQISSDDLMAFGLIGGKNARKRRERLGDLLKIGFTNGKQLYKRLLMFKITKDEFSEAIRKVLKEEENE